MGKKEPRNFSHFDSSGNVQMVDVSAKKSTLRFAKASALISLSRSTLSALLTPHSPLIVKGGNRGVKGGSQRGIILKKGDPLITAKIAGILAAKRAHELIPLTHPVPITHCDISFDLPSSSPVLRPSQGTGSFSSPSDPSPARGEGKRSYPSSLRGECPDEEVGTRHERPPEGERAGSEGEGDFSTDEVGGESEVGIKIIATVKTKSETGVEMEALTAVTVAALTIYDMVKSQERGAVIEKIQLEEKWGGKSGHYKRQ